MPWSYELGNPQRMKKSILIRKRMTEASSFELTFCAKQANVSFPIMRAIIYRVSFDFDSDSLSPNDHFTVMNFSSLHWSVFVSVCSCACLHLFFFFLMCMCGLSGHCPWSAWTGIGGGGVWQRPWPGWLPGEVLPTVSMRYHPQSHALNCMSRPPVPLQAERHSRHRTESHFVRWSDGRPWYSHRL